MSRFVQAEDFSSGEYSIPVDEYTSDDLQSYIDDKEPSILRALLGVELYKDFITDYDAVPENQFSEDRFKVLYEPFAEDAQCGIIESKGVVYLLQAFIFYSYMADLENSKRANGFVKEHNDNSDATSGMSSGLYSKHNKGVETHQAIQSYICRNPENYDYTKFNGQIKEFITWF